MGEGKREWRDFRSPLTSVLSPVDGGEEDETAVVENNWR